jgi:hypothetical protein
VRDRGDRRIGRGDDVAAAYPLDLGGQPALAPAAGRQGPPVPWARGREAVHQRDQVRGQFRQLVVGHRDAGPPGHRAGDDQRHLVEEGHRRPAAPALRGLVERLTDQLGQHVDAVVHQQRHEQRLAVPVGRTVERVHRTLAEQRGHDGMRQRGVALEVALVVEEPHGLRSADGHRPLTQHPQGHGPVVVLAAQVGQPGVALDAGDECLVEVCHAVVHPPDTAAETAASGSQE